MRTKLVAELSYLGTRFIGWQPQPAEEGIAVYDEVAPALRAAASPRAGRPTAPATRTHSSRDVVRGRSSASISPAGGGSSDGDSDVSAYLARSREMAI